NSHERLAERLAEENRRLVELLAEAESKRLGPIEKPRYCSVVRDIQLLINKTGGYCEHVSKQTAIKYLLGPCLDGQDHPASGRSAKERLLNLRIKNRQIRTRGTLKGKI